MKIKSFFQRYKPHMARPIVNKAFVRFIAGLVLSLLWDRFINADNLYSIMDRPFFLFGFVFLAMAWFNYLKLDGVKLPRVSEKRQKKAAKKKHKTENMIDFADGERGAIDALDDEEETLAAFGANIITGLCFMIPAIFYLLSI